MSEGMPMPKPPLGAVVRFARGSDSSTRRIALRGVEQFEEGGIWRVYYITRPIRSMEPEFKYYEGELVLA